MVNPLTTDKKHSKYGVLVGRATVGVDLEKAITSMKPGEVKVVDGILRKFLIRYSADETVTIVQLNDGKVIYKG
jgi:hypothetical protein